MTEQAFPVSLLAEMSGMFSVMAEQYVSNLGLPQCYGKGGGGENLRGEKVSGETDGGGEHREMTLFFTTVLAWKRKIPVVM